MTRINFITFSESGGGFFEPRILVSHQYSGLAFSLCERGNRVPISIESIQFILQIFYENAQRCLENATWISHRKNWKKSTFLNEFFTLRTIMMSVWSDYIFFFHQYYRFDFSKTCQEYRICGKEFSVSDSGLFFHAKNDGVLHFFLECVLRLILFAIKLPTKSKWILKNLNYRFCTMFWCSQRWCTYSVLIYDWWFVCYRSKTTCFMETQTKHDAGNYRLRTSSTCWKRWRCLFLSAEHL